MTQHLLRQVAADINELDALLPEGLHLSLNVSPSQVAKPGFVFDTLSFLAAIPLEKYCLVVEVTEEQPLPPTPEVTGAFLKLQLAGVEIYLDDFGTGCSNLAYLEQFRVDGVKIDQLSLSIFPQIKHQHPLQRGLRTWRKRGVLASLLKGSKPLNNHNCCAIWGLLFSRASCFPAH